MSSVNGNIETFAGVGGRGQIYLCDEDDADIDIILDEIPFGLRIFSFSWFFNI